MVSKLSIFCLLALSSSFALGQDEPVKSFINPHIILEENWEGWGTSLAWWADMVGGMEDEVVDHVVDALFSPSKLNLNIARYVIGGTTLNNHSCGEYRPGSATESYKDGPDEPYNWERDPRQRKVLTQAKAVGANKFEAFSNSPPQWMTISGCSKGQALQPPVNPNLASANVPLFTEYATDVIKHFHENLNITFHTYSPFNEPYGLHGVCGWLGSLSSQEGCCMTRPIMSEVVKSLQERKASKNLDFLKLSVSDETQVNTQIANYEYFVDKERGGISSMIEQVNVHGYWNDFETSRKDLLGAQCRRNGHVLWMDEMGWGGTPTDNMEQGLNIAERIVDDLRQLRPSAWVYWQAVEDYGQWGLLDVPYRFNATLDEINYNSGYYGLQQFSQHIREGFKIVHVSDESAVAALSEDLKTLVIVTFNAGEEETSHEFDLGLFDTAGEVKLWRTSATEQHATLPPPSVSNEMKLNLVSPPQSISTLEIAISFPSEAPRNLVGNPGFELTREGSGSLLPQEWNFIAYSGNPDGVTDDKAYEATYSGIIQLGPLVISNLSQHFSFNEGERGTNCTLYMTAYVVATHQGVYLTLLGNEMIEKKIERTGVYHAVSIKVEKESGLDINISFTNYGASTGIGGFAKIDEVVLHAKCPVQAKA